VRVLAQVLLKVFENWRFVLIAREVQVGERMMSHEWSTQYGRVLRRAAEDGVGDSENKDRKKRVEKGELVADISPDEVSGDALQRRHGNSSCRPGEDLVITTEYGWPNTASKIIGSSS